MIVPLRPLLALVLGAAAVTSCGSASPSSNQPAASRTIQMQMNDQLRFDPGTVTVHTGETVVFSVRNAGKLDHEFTLGDQAMQDSHEQEMRGMSSSSGMHMGGGSAVDVAPGQSKTLRYTFSKTPGTYLYGCHVTGHYAAGMRGVITIR